MAELTMWLLAAYGFSSLLVMLLDRWANRMGSSADDPCEHYCLLVRNSEQVLEATLRRLRSHSYWSGKPIRITLQDEGSNDDTLRIADLYRRYPYCLLADGMDRVPESAVIIDLRQKETDNMAKV